MLPDEVPKTSLPTMGDAMDLLTTIKEEGYTHVIAVTVSQNLSGTYSMLQGLVGTAKDQFGLEMSVISSKGISMATGWLIVRAAEYNQQGLDCKTTVQRVKEQGDNSTDFFTVKVIE